MSNSSTKLSPRDQVLKKLNSDLALRPFPRVVNQLLSAFDDPNAGSKRFAGIIETDPALSARLLRMANSPLYGFSNVIRTIEHATVVLGIGPLRNIALTYAGSSMFVGAEAKDEFRNQLWRHSLGCATVARVLAKHSGRINSDEAFLAGVFHDIGKLFLYDEFAADYLELAAQQVGATLSTCELENLNITHEEVGEQLIKTWCLPEPLMVVAARHHAPQDAIAHKELVSTVHAADIISHMIWSNEAFDDLEQLHESYHCIGVNAELTEKIATEAIQLFEQTQLEEH